LPGGTPQQPLVEPEELFDAKIVDVTPQTLELSVRVSMPGREAVQILPASSSKDAEHDAAMPGAGRK
jgi:hypothetical protein